MVQHDTCFVMVQEAKLPPSAVKDLKKLAHQFLPHCAVFVRSLSANADPGPDAVRHEVDTLFTATLQLGSPSWTFRAN